LENKFQKYGLISLAVVAILFIGNSYLQSAKLVSDFEKNVEKSTFVPKANTIEFSEIDKDSHRGWKIKSKRSVGNADLDQVVSYDIQAFIFDDEDNPKMEITSPKATSNRKTGLTILEGPAEIVMLEKNSKIISDKFTMQKGSPFEALGNVQIHLSEDGAKKVLANKAIVSQAMDNVTLYQVAESRVSDSLLIKGGQMNIEYSGKGKEAKPQKIILFNGAWVKSGDTVCQSARMDVFLDGNGDPTLAVFTGSPVATQKGTQIRASRIEYGVKNGKIKASGNVRTKLI
jgi:lipopolysaccharide assembly outer membrane protein LptD (OstA)